MQSFSRCHLKYDIDRSLKKFDTNFDISCLDEMEDELVNRPQESFAALCYQDAVARISYYGQDLSVSSKAPDPINWDHSDDVSTDSGSSLVSSNQTSNYKSFT